MTTDYLLYDGHGSTRQLADSTGNITSTYAFDAYGHLLGTQAGATPKQATSLLYAGEQFDAGLQQYYLRARYYDQNTGRFNRLDPFAGNQYDPQSLHKYAYCHNDPVNATDPSGELALGGPLWLVATLLLVNIAIFAIFTIPRVWGPWGRMPTPEEKAHIDATRNYIRENIVGITLTNLTTESSVTVPASFGTFDAYRVGEEMQDCWARTPEFPRLIILVNKSSKPYENWFSLPVGQAAVVAVHELFHKHWWLSLGWFEENEAWEITAHLWHKLGLPHAGSLFSDIEEMSDKYGFPLPW